MGCEAGEAVPVGIERFWDIGICANDEGKGFEAADTGGESTGQFCESIWDWGEDWVWCDGPAKGEELRKIHCWRVLVQHQFYFNHTTSIQLQYNFNRNTTSIIQPQFQLPCPLPFSAIQFQNILPISQNHPPLLTATSASPPLLLLLIYHPTPLLSTQQQQISLPGKSMPPPHSWACDSATAPLQQARNTCNEM